MRHINAWPSTEDDRATDAGVPVVGVGASAGGLAACQELLSHTPPDTGLAFVLVQHLDPSRESLPATVLQRYTRMPVVQAADGMAVEANHVYTIAPNTELSLLRCALRRLPLPDKRGPRLPIDAFFRSLASACKARAIGIVLSGAGSDGALGLREIKEAGGLAIAQDPETAIYSTMPLSAIETPWLPGGLGYCRKTGLPWTRKWRPIAPASGRSMMSSTAFATETARSAGYTADVVSRRVSTGRCRLGRASIGISRKPKSTSWDCVPVRPGSERCSSTPADDPL